MWRDSFVTLGLHLKNFQERFLGKIPHIVGRRCKISNRTIPKIFLTSRLFNKITINFIAISNLADEVRFSDSPVKVPTIIVESHLPCVG